MGIVDNDGVGDNSSGQTANGDRLLIAACGAAQVVMLPSFLVAFRSNLGCRLTVVATATAARFMAPRTLGLFCDEVIDSTDPEVAFKSNHAALASGHRLIIVLPATANVIADVANGHASNLVSTTILASSRPAIFVPAMNGAMWRKASVQRNVQQLRDDQHEVIDPEWRESYEVSSRSMVEHPAIPGPTDLIGVVKSHLHKVAS